MKMKQKLAATLAGVMAMSMVPVTSAFAASATTTADFVKIAKGDSVVSFTGGSNFDALKIVTEKPLEKGDAFFLELSGDAAARFETFGVKKDGDYILVETEEYTKSDKEKFSGTKYKYVKADEQGSLVRVGTNTFDLGDWVAEGLDETSNKSKPADLRAGDNLDTTGKLTDVSGNVYDINGTTLYFTYGGDAVAANKDGLYEYQLPYAVKRANKEGSVELTVESNNTPVRDAVMTIIQAIGTSLPATIKSGMNGLEEADVDYVEIKDITISESISMATLNSTTSNKNTYFFKIESNNPDFTWIDKDAIEDADEFDDYGEVAYSDLGYVKIADVDKFITVKGEVGLKDAISNNDVSLYVGNGGQDLYVGIKANSKTTNSARAKGNIVISGLKLYKVEDADEYSGEVSISLKTVSIDKEVRDGYEYNNGKITKGAYTTFQKDQQAMAVSPSAEEWVVLDDVAKMVTATAKAANVSKGNKKVTSGQITIKENIKGAINREIEIEVPEGVSIVGFTKSVKSKQYNGDDTGYETYNIYDEKAKKVVIEDQPIDITANSETLFADDFKGASMDAHDVRKIELNPIEGRQEALNATFQLYLSIDSDYEGDTVDAIITTRYGEGKERETFEQTVTIAKIDDYTIDIEMKDSQIDGSGRKQSVADIVLTETKAGQFARGKEVWIALPAELIEDMQFSDYDDEIEVVEGDVKVSDLTQTDAGYLKFTVTSKSTKASKIVISGLKVTTKGVPNGVYDVRVTGEGVGVNNDYYQDVIKTWAKDLDDKSKNFDQDDIEDLVEDCLDGEIPAVDKFYSARKVSSIIVGDAKKEETTPSVKVETEKFELSVNASTYVVNGEARPLLAKPYVKVTDALGNGDVMVPVRAIAEMLGFQVDWVDGVTTFTSPDGRYAQWKADGKDAITVDGRNYVLRYAPALSEKENVDGATFVWLRDLTRVLGVADDAVVWNGDGTITVTATVAK